MVLKTRELNSNRPIIPRVYQNYFQSLPSGITEKLSFPPSVSTLPTSHRGGKNEMAKNIPPSKCVSRIPVALVCHVTWKMK